MVNQTNSADINGTGHCYTYTKNYKYNKLPYNRINTVELGSPFVYTNRLNVKT